MPRFPRRRGDSPRLGAAAIGGSRSPSWTLTGAPRASEHPRHGEWKAVEGFLPLPPLSAKNLLQQPTYPMAGLPPCIIGRCRIGLVYDCALLPFLFPFLRYLPILHFPALWISLCSDRHVMAVSPPGSQIVGVIVGALALFALISIFPV